MRRNRLHIALFLGCLWGTSAHAGKIELMLGAYSFSAISPSKTGSLTSLGAYRVAFSQPVFSAFEVSLGYTILASQIVAGDVAYGFDLGLAWFPLSHASTTVIQRSEQTLTISENWRPYVGASFVQRQFQVVQTGYAGIGFKAGVEHPLSSSLYLRGEMRYILYSADVDSSAREFDLFMGVVFGF